MVDQKSFTELVIRQQRERPPQVSPYLLDSDVNDDVSPVPGSHTPENNTPENHTSENHAPENQTSENQTPENQTPKNQVTPNYSRTSERKEKQLTDISLPYLDEVYNTVRKKEKTPDYGRVSHHRSRKMSYSRLTRFSDQMPPKGPFFISFKETPELVQTDYYVDDGVTTFFDQAFWNPRCIGKGSFGEVFKALSKDDNRWYAVKITVEPFLSPSDRDNKLREVQKHELLPKHPNLVSYKRAWEEYGYLYIQTELCRCNLREYQMQVGVICERELWRFFGDIALAVRFLHSKELLHLDIKPTNVMISFDGICKLGDFSLIFDITKDEKREEGDGKYLAPEVLGKGCSKQSDIYALGMTMIDISTVYELPQRGDLWLSIRRGCIPSQFTEDVPPALLAAILPLLEVDPNKRPSAEEICSRTDVAQFITERQNEYLERNMWWILLTVGYVSLFATSYIVQPARTVRMHGVNYLKRKRARLSAHHCVFKATSEESPMFTYRYIPKPGDFKIPILEFDDDDEDYVYSDNDDNSVDGEEKSHSDEELLNEAGSSACEEPHFDESGSSSRMDVDAQSPNVSRSTDGYGGDAQGLGNFFRNRRAICGFGAAGDAFEGNDCDDLLKLETPKKRSCKKKNGLLQDKNSLSYDDSSSDVLEYDDSGIPSLSGSIIERPKSPEPPLSTDQSPNFDFCTTPPNVCLSSPLFCSTPLRGGSEDAAERSLRNFYRWREARLSPTAITHSEMRKRTALINGMSPEGSDEAEHSPSGMRLRKKAEPVDETSRRRIHLPGCESSPPAKRTQMKSNEENSIETEDLQNKLEIKKDTDKDMNMDID